MLVFLVVRIVAGIFVAVRPPLTTKLQGRFSGSELARKQREVGYTAANRWNSILHAFVLIWASWHALFNSPDNNLWEDRVFGQDPVVSKMMTFAVSYFLFDCLDMLIHPPREAGIFLHHLCTTVTCGMATRPFVHYHSCMFALWELSTPLLHARALMLTYGHGQGVVFQAISVLLFASFFLVRVVLGAWMVSGLFGDLLPFVQQAYSTGVWTSLAQNSAVALGLTVLGFGLILFWFALMAKGLLAIITGQDKVKAKKTQ